MKLSLAEQPLPVLSGYVDYDLSAYFVDISEMMYYAADNSLIVSKVGDGGIFKIDIAHAHP